MSAPSVVDVVDGTDLTTLVGQGAEKGEYKKLVEKLFSSELGNLKWFDVKKYTRAGFVTKYGKGNDAIEDKLESWINNYGLEFQKGECWSYLSLCFSVSICGVFAQGVLFSAS